MKRTATTPPDVQVIHDARLCYSGHVARSGGTEDRHRAISAALKIRRYEEWKRLPAKATWPKTAEKSLAPQHIGRHDAQNRSTERVEPHYEQGYAP